MFRMVVLTLVGNPQQKDYAVLLLMNNADIKT